MVYGGALVARRPVDRDQRWNGKPLVLMLLGFGLPPPVAHMLRSADEGIARGDLDDRGGELHRLIGRPTTPLAQAVAVALKR